MVWHTFLKALKVEIQLRIALIILFHKSFNQIHQPTPTISLLLRLSTLCHFRYNIH